MQLTQNLCLFHGLYPFGDDIQGQGPSQVDHRTEEGVMAGVSGNPFDETAVDLQRRYRQLLQAGERGMTCAKVVQCKRDTQIAQPLQFGERCLFLLHQGGFGELEFQAVGWKAVTFEQAAHVIVERLAAQTQEL